MKRKCLLVSLLAMACSLAASAYVPLVREGVKWVYFEEYDDSPDNGYYSKGEYAMELFGDSTINGVTYKKVFLYPLHQAIDFNTSKPYALVREANKVVYIYLGPSMMDLELQYEEVERYGEFPMLTTMFQDEYVLYDFNDINRPFSRITEEHIEMSGSNFKIPPYTYSETIELQGESAKVYVGETPMPYLIEGIGYVGSFGQSLVKGWTYTAADFIRPLMIGYPIYSYAFSYMADADGNVLYKGPAYTKMCDVNEDDKVDGDDLNILINAVLTGNKRYNYDANGDSAVDGADINEVINFILKK